jgi:hypothetical protein
MIVLKPSIGVISIERTFREISTIDEHWGYYVVTSIGRLECPDTDFNLRVTVITSRPEDIFDNHAIKRFLPSRMVTKREIIVTAQVNNLLPKTDTTYVIRLGKINLERDKQYDVRVRIELMQEHNQPHAGLVFL